MQASAAIVIKNVRAVDPRSSLDGTIDITIADGRLRHGLPAEGTSSRVIDGTGRWLLPAFCDVAASLGEPGYEYREGIGHGLQVAAGAGYCAVAVLPDTNPPNDGRAVTEMMLRRAHDSGATTLLPVAALTRRLEGQQLTEMGELAAAGAAAVGDGRFVVARSGILRRAFEYATSFGLPVLQQPNEPELTETGDAHEGVLAETLGLRGLPIMAETIGLNRDLDLAAHADARYHALEVSSAGALRVLRRHLDQGTRASAGVSPAHLLLTEAAVRKYDPAAKLFPPLRAEEDRQALRDALADGTLSVLTSGHRPLSVLEKDCEFCDALFGASGLELTLPAACRLVAEGVVSVARVVEVLSTNPAELLGLSAPSLADGASASVTLVDPEAPFSAAADLRSRGKFTPLAGTELRGRALLTLHRGIITHDALVERAGQASTRPPESNEGRGDE